MFAPSMHTIIRIPASLVCIATLCAFQGLFGQFVCSDMELEGGKECIGFVEIECDPIETQCFNSGNGESSRCFRMLQFVPVCEANDVDPNHCSVCADDEDWHVATILVWDEHGCGIGNNQDWDYFEWVYYCGCDPLTNT